MNIFLLEDDDAIGMGLKYSLEKEGYKVDLLRTCKEAMQCWEKGKFIKNCYEHMSPGGQLKLEARDTSLYRQILISDTGCGICGEDLPHIFERFYKGKNAGKDSVGIGLALSKTVLESQRGDILVESKEGTGTSFDIRFYKTLI